MNAYTRITPGIGPLAPIAGTANQQIAKQIVERLLAFRTASPFAMTWQHYAVSEIAAALNEASKRGGRAHG
jgi:hypothetical protein